MVKPDELIKLCDDNKFRASNEEITYVSNANIEPPIDFHIVRAIIVMYRNDITRKNIIKVCEDNDFLLSEQDIIGYFEIEGRTDGRIAPAYQKFEYIKKTIIMYQKYNIRLYPYG